MKPSDHDHSRKTEEMIESTLMFSKHYHVSMMVALITVGTLALLGYGGYQLDLFLGTKKVFMVLGLIVSFPISQFALYKWIKEKYIPNVKKLSKNK